MKSEVSDAVVQLKRKTITINHGETVALFTVNHLYLDVMLIWHYLRYKRKSPKQNTAKQLDNMPFMLCYNQYQLN